MKNKITISGIIIIASIIIISSQTLPQSVFAVTNEGNYHSYSIITNVTTSYPYYMNPYQMKLSDTGSVFFADDQNTYIFGITGANKALFPSISKDHGTQYLDQSETGMYRVFIDSNSTIDLKVYKNDVLLQTINIKTNQFYSNTLNSVGIAISPAAKYITLVGQDNTTGNYRIEVLQGA